MTYQLLHGDCLDIMPTLTGIDAVVTDPPYLVSAGAGGGAFGNRSHLVNTGGFTDGGIDYDFLSTFKNWVCFCSKRQLKKLIEVAEFSDHWNLITWAKPNPVPTCNNKYLPDVEYAIHAFSAKSLYGNYEDKQSFYLGNSARVTKHPNEKPLELMVKLIKLSTKVGQTVFDPFCGSGTTGVACLLTGRNFIGIEKDKGYYDIAVKRCADAASQPRLFDVVEPIPQAQALAFGF